MQYPKILLISPYNIFEDNDATSISIRSILKNWPKEKIAEIYCGVYDDIDNNSNSKLSLDVNDVFMGSLIEKLRNRKHKFENKETINELVLVDNHSKSAKFLSKLKFFLSGSADLFSYKKTKIDEFVKEQKPDIIYLIPYGIRMLDLANYINKKYNIPIIPHFMDDWISTLYSDSELMFLQKKQLNNKFTSLMKNISHSFVISEAMKIEYQKRYNDKNFHALMNSPSVNLPNSIEAKEITKICYFGSLHLNRWNSLNKICKIIKENQINIKIDLYSNDWDLVKNNFSDYDFVTCVGFIPPHQVNKTMKNYDAVLFIESFDNSVKKYTKFSMSTKIPEYLSSGLPIIAVGPSDIASVSYLKNNKVALVLDDENLIQWNSLIKNFVTDLESIEKCVQLSLKLFTENHDSSKVLDNFIKIVNDAK